MNCPVCGVAEGALHKPGCLQKVVDDWLLTESKARAWDAFVTLRRQFVFENGHRPGLYDPVGSFFEELDALVHSAHNRSIS